MNKHINRILLSTLLLNTLLTADSEMFTLEPDDMFEMSFTDLMDVEISSADKTAVPIKDIPANVTIVTRNEIQKYGYTTLLHILKNIPSLYMIDNTERIFAGVRGNSGGGLQFLVNGVNVHPSIVMGLTSTDINQFNIPVDAIDRIEVVRGPMSVMYGNNAFFGIVNIVINDISSEDALASVSYGSRNSGKLFARYGHKYEDGSFIVNAGYSKTEGLDGDYADMYSAQQLESLHPDAASTMDGGMSQKKESISLSAKYKDFNADINYKKMDFGYHPFNVNFGNDNNLEMTTTQASLAYNPKLTDTLDLKIIGILSQENYNVPESDYSLPTQRYTQEQNSRRDELEMNLVYKKDSLKIVTGYRYRELDNIDNSVLVYNSNESLLAIDVKVNDISTNELFSQLSYKFSTKLSMTAGLRYLRLPSSYESATVINGETTQDKTAIDDRDRYTGRFALLYDISNNQNIKFLIGNATYDSSSQEFTNPEEITTYEINHLLIYPHFQFTTSLFYNDIKAINQYYHNTDPDTLDVYRRRTNDGEWKSYGVELILNYNIAKNFNLNASLTAQDTQDENRDIDVEYSPSLLAKLRADYKHNGVTYAFNTNYISKMKTSYTYDETNQEALRLGSEVDGYFLLGANIRYDFIKDAYLNLNASNLLDTQYCYPAREAIPMEKGLIGMGRIITATLGYKF